MPDTIEITVGNRTFTLPMREIALEYLATDEKLRNKHEWIVRGNDFTVLIRSFYGDYYPAKDSMSISSLNGFLFFK